MRRRRISEYRSIEEEGTINLTSLIDVVFVVLIMFIIVAPMLELDRVELASHHPVETKQMAPMQDQHPLAIYVLRDNTIWFNGQAISPEQLGQLLRNARAQTPQKIPQIFHDKKAHFETYQTIKNAVEAAGFEQMDVILKP